MFWMFLWELAQAPRGINNAKIALALATALLLFRSLLECG